MPKAARLSGLPEPDTTYAGFERDFNSRTPPSQPEKVTEDQELSKGRGPIRPLTERDLANRGRAAVDAVKRRRMVASRSVGGKR